jgi:hypothetical protein
VGGGKTVGKLTPPTPPGPPRSLRCTLRCLLK